jgi:hypothetical protein
MMRLGESNSCASQPDHAVVAPPALHYVSLLMPLPSVLLGCDGCVAWLNRLRQTPLQCQQQQQQ